MSCFLCGHEETHHLGCEALRNPGLQAWQAVEMGLLAPADLPEEVQVDVVEVLKEGTMTTVPQMITVGQCELEGCDNPKHSDHPRVKYCEDHKDPKNR